jgi:membrane protein DedA with SNARE-associated domain
MSFEQILEFIRSQNEFVIYAILLVSAFVENIFPPFPGDAVMLAGVYIAGEGGIDYIGVLISVIVGGTAGAMVLYWLGRTGGRRFFETGKGRFLVKGNLQKAERLFARHGNGLILISRFFAVIRSAIAVTAGIVNFNVNRMLVLTILSFILWNGLLLGLMVYSKANWRIMVDVIKQYNLVFVVIGVLALIVWIARAIWIKKQNSKSPS